MAKSVTMVCCKLPHGIVLQHPMDANNTVTLNGLNKAIIIGAQYTTNAVDSDFWDHWILANADFPAVKSGAIFAAENTQVAAKIAKETEKEKTGFEPMDKNAHGVKPTGKD
jgi:hypothetical protein